MIHEYSYEILFFITLKYCHSSTVQAQLYSVTRDLLCGPLSFCFHAQILCMAKPLVRLCRCAVVSVASLMAYVGLNTAFAIIVPSILQDLHRLEKYLNLEGFLEN